MSVNFFSSPQNVSTSTTGSYVTTSVSSYVSSAATAVILRWTNIDGGNEHLFDLRMKGSTDSFTGTQRMSRLGGGWAIVGLNSSKQFEQYHDSASMDLYLWGYFEDECVMFTNSVNMSTATTGSYVDVDITPYIGGDSSSAAIVVSRPNALAASGAMYLRKNGSTDDRTSSASDRTYYYVVGTDASNIFEQKIDNVNRDLYLAGYFRYGITMATNGTDVSRSGAGSYADLTNAGQGIAGVIYEVHETSTTSQYGLRQNGSSHNSTATNLQNALNTTKQQAIIECDRNGIVEGTVAALTTDFYQMGTFPIKRRIMVT